MFAFFGFVLYSIGEQLTKRTLKMCIIGRIQRRAFMGLSLFSPTCDYLIFGSFRTRGVDNVNTGRYEYMRRCLFSDMRDEHRGQI